ncbi:MAG: hypothetical protein FWC97_03805 [Treponema sp.]|nr:hypothetical protein [Treponema sp.]
MKTFKQTWKALVLLLSFALLLVGCDFESTTGPAHTVELEEILGDGRLPEGIAFEIKFLLCPEQTIDENGNLRWEVIELFNNALPWVSGEGNPATSGHVVNRDVVQHHLDTRHRDLFSAGWITRIRHLVRTNVLDVTYRKRIPIVSGTRLTEADVQRVVLQAKRENIHDWAWDSPDGSVEFDWSYNSAVLTVSWRIDLSGAAFTNAMNNSPYSTLVGARELLRSQFPFGSTDFNLTNPNTNRVDFEEWFFDKIDNDVILHGPAFIRRHRTRGTISAADSLRLFGVEKQQRVDFDIEVLPLRCGSFLVEVSSSSEIYPDPVPSGVNRTNTWESFDQVAALRQFMHDFVLEAGILVPETGLRTTTILNTMGQTPPREPQD